MPEVTEEQAAATVSRAMELGINHYETARGYENSEEILGRALKSFDRSGFILTTKITTKHYQNYRKYIEESLNRLQVDYIDNFDLHGINTEEQIDQAFRKDGALNAVHQAMSEGLIRHVGFSSHGTLDIILRVIETGEFDSVNLHYYYSNQRHLPAIIRAGEKDMG
ncbi:MAG: aldo/keto reductase, partial [Nitrospira sp.]|nr:aldo/keto reductase [Nitrospira sp.]